MDSHGGRPQGGPSLSNMVDFEGVFGEPTRKNYTKVDRVGSFVAALGRYFKQYKPYSGASGFYLGVFINRYSGLTWLDTYICIICLSKSGTSQRSIPEPYNLFAVLIFRCSQKKSTTMHHKFTIFGLSLVGRALHLHQPW